MTYTHELRENDTALLDQVRAGDTNDLDAEAVQRLANLRRLGVVQVVRGTGDEPDTWSVIGDKPKRSSRSAK